MFNKSLALLLVVFSIISCSNCTESSEAECEPSYKIGLEKYSFGLGYYPEGAEERALDLGKLELLGGDSSITEKYGFEYDFYFKVTNVTGDDTITIKLSNQDMIVGEDTLSGNQFEEMEMRLVPKADTTIFIRYVFSGNKISPNTMKTIGEEEENEFEFVNHIQTTSSKGNPCAELDSKIGSYTFKDKKESEPLSDSERKVVEIIITIIGALFK